MPLGPVLLIVVKKVEHHFIIDRVLPILATTVSICFDHDSLQSRVKSSSLVSVHMPEHLECKRTRSSQPLTGKESAAYEYKSNKIVFVTCTEYHRCSRPYSEMLTYKPLTNNA